MIYSVNDVENNYIDYLINEVFELISKGIDSQTSENLIKEHYEKRLNDRMFGNFQEYYFRTINDREYFLQNNFFAEFRQMYSLRGIDNIFIKQLEEKKVEILKLIDSNNLVELYTEYFAKAQIKHSGKIIEKNLGSFFTKLVHTFRPEEYTPLDNAIKKYFGLYNESYFISMIAISRAYIKWANSQRRKVASLRKQLIESNKVGSKATITDLKLLNILFWSIAEKKHRIGSQ